MFLAKPDTPANWLCVKVSKYWFQFNPWSLARNEIKWGSKSNTEFAKTSAAILKSSSFIQSCSVTWDAVSFKLCKKWKERFRDSKGFIAARSVLAATVPWFSALNAASCFARIASRSATTARCATPSRASAAASPLTKPFGSYGRTRQLMTFSRFINVQFALKMRRRSNSASKTDTCFALTVATKCRTSFVPFAAALEAFVDHFPRREPSGCFWRLPATVSNSFSPEFSEAVKNVLGRISQDRNSTLQNFIKSSNFLWCFIYCSNTKVICKKSLLYFLFYDPAKSEMLEILHGLKFRSWLKVLPKLDIHSYAHTHTHMHADTHLYRWSFLLPSNLKMGSSIVTFYL